MAIKTQKTWLEVRFTEGEISVDLTINYEKKTFSISHGSNDNCVTYSGDEGELPIAFTRHKLVLAALDYANKQL
jgi:hypothetical protein